LDVNLACHAPMIRSARAGSALFLDREALVQVLERLRRAWTGPLTVKIRLGQNKTGWEDVLRDRLALFESSGVDVVTIHTRFFEDKYKRRAKRELFPVIRDWTCLPLVASGELHEADGSPLHEDGALEGYDGLMVGRMAVVRPWLFRTWRGGDVVDPSEVWTGICEGLLEAFPEPGARGRLKQFTLYLSRNYLFGHTFAMAVRAAKTVPEMQDLANRFFERNPERVVIPNLAGLA
jgi:tRNA-dihydrouridine synthase